MDSIGLAAPLLCAVKHWNAVGIYNSGEYPDHIRSPLVDNNDAFDHGELEPLVDTVCGGVYANRFTSGRKRNRTLFNSEACCRVRDEAFLQSILEKSHIVNTFIPNRKIKTGGVFIMTIVKKYGKMFLVSAALLMAAGFSAGCSSMVDGGTVKVAAVNAKASGLVIPGPRVWIAADESVADDVLSEQCRKYVANAVRHLGLKEAPAADQADLIVLYSYKEEKPDGKKTRTSVTLNATQAKTRNQVWQGEAFCISKQPNLPQYLPSLVAAAAVFLNKNVNDEIVLEKYPNMMKSVAGSNAK